jgi:A/G-specific adenine glycosylase
VACFAYGLPVSMVDTNVRRVLGRVFDGDADGIAERVVPKHAAYAWNQALMDLGATLCRADKPLCLLCPLVDVCSAAGQVTVRERRRQPPFAGSTRYIRGRILDALCTLPDGAAVSLASLAEALHPLPFDASRLRKLTLQMAEEGLIAFDSLGSVHLA